MMPVQFLSPRGTQDCSLKHPSSLRIYAALRLARAHSALARIARLQSGKPAGSAFTLMIRNLFCNNFQTRPLPNLG